MEERRDMAQEAWRAYLELAIGATDATRKKATRAVRRLVGKSAVPAEQLQRMAEDLVKTSAANREAMTKLVRYELDRALGAVGLATADEVAALTERVRELEAQLRAATVAPVAKSDAAAPVGAEVVEETAVAAAPAPVKKTAVKKAVAKKTVAKKTATKTAVAQEAAPAKTAPAKTAPAKAAATKTAAARKTVTKKTAATVAKKAPARRGTTPGSAG
jgi:polyhydroxyalkanoate synthesis regulator phasin